MVDRELVKAIAIWSEQLAHQYCNIALQYCNLAGNRTPDFTVRMFYQFIWSQSRLQSLLCAEPFDCVLDPFSLYCLPCALCKLCNLGSVLQNAKFDIIKTTYLQPVVFTEHMRCITALCFGNKIEPILLASGSEDCVIVWFLENDASFDG